MLNASETVRSTKTDDGRVLLDVRYGQMFSVNIVGSNILELVEKGWDEPHIAEEISRVPFDTRASKASSEYSA